MTEQIERPNNNNSDSTENINNKGESSSRSASSSSCSTSSSAMVKKSLSPAPIPSTTAWNVVKSDVVPSLDFSVIIPPKKAAPAAASSNTRRNRKKSKKREGGNEKKTRSHSRTKSRTQQQPLYFSDISVGAQVDWPSPQAKQSSIEACAQQLEYYFSINNLLKDMYLRKHMNSQGWIFLNDVAKFTRMKAISGGDTAVLQDSLKLARNVSWGYTQSHDFQHIKLRSNITPENWVLPLADRLPSGADEASPSETHSLDN